MGKCPTFEKCEADFKLWNRKYRIILIPSKSNNETKGTQEMIDKWRSVFLSYHLNLFSFCFLFYVFNDISIMFEPIKDSHWNKIICEKVKKWEKFYLYLQWYEYRRLIAHLVDGILHFVRTPDHVFVKTNSYGFNDQFIRKFAPETVVIVREKWTKSKLKTTVWEILENWKYMFFLAQWFEKQIFMSRSLFSSLK